VRLLGAQTLISGISANIAQTLVGLGVALDNIHTVSDLGQALDLARATAAAPSPLDR
jgi:rsbT co-antagonist protein RsbR